MQIYSIAKFTIKENISNKVFNSFVIFGVVIMLFCVVLKELSLYEEAKVILDSGVFLIEFFVLLITIFTSSTLFLKDKKEKSIYLILTKPVSRSMYITGRVLGLIFTVFLNIFIMGGVLLIIMMWQKIPINFEYVKILLFMFYKLSIVATLGVFFSVVSDSFMSANIFTFSVYIIAHGVIEIKMMAEKVTKVFLKYSLELLYYILPNFRILNYRDYLQPIDVDITKVTLYFLAYVCIVTCITNIIFSKKRI